MINSVELESTGIRNILAMKLWEFIQIPSYFIDTAITSEEDADEGGVIDGPFLNFSTQGLASFLKFRPIKGRIFLSVEFLNSEPGVYF